MTVPASQANRYTYAGNGVTTAFAYSSKFLANADLVVVLVNDTTGVETVKTLTTHYTVAGAGTSAGTVTMLTAPATGETLVIYGDPVISQLVDPVNGDDLDVDTVIEAPLDRLTIIARRLKDIVTRTLRQPEGDTADIDRLPAKADRASNFLAFDADGDPIAAAGTTGVPVSAFMETLLDDTSAAAARTTLGAVGSVESAAALVTALEKTIPQCGRLTLTTALPVTTADVTGATTVYFTPYKGNVVALFDGTDWVPTVFTELSQTTADNTKSPAAVANNSNYDIFVWNDSGTLRATRGPAWSSASPGSSSRGTGAGTTELELLEGRYVNKVAITNGPAAQRGLYVGTIKSDGSAQINDSQTIRNVWNNYNRVSRSVRVTDSTDTWSYTTNTWRQANGAAANLIEYVCGLVEDSASISASACTSNSSGGVDVATGIGLNSSSALAADCLSSYLSAPTTIENMSSHYRGLPALGRNQFVWLEISSATGTTTWFGDGGVPNNMRNGLIGEVMA